MANTAELMRICGPLYPSIALESAANIGLFIFFSYLSILISTKQQLKTPGRAFCRMVWGSLREWSEDTYRVLRRWPHMHEMELGQRFRYCRRLNATICRISAFIALLAITRWFHINNVNGFRYLGYAITCPLMQAELVLLIAPYVWCYRLLTVFSCVITFGMLVSGYAASQFEGNPWKTDFADFYDGALEGNFDSLTMKGWVLMPSTLILCFLSFVQIPVLGLVYYYCGGSKNEELPKGYPKLLVITSLSWFGFPLWWFLSYEGASIITDTRWNSAGFVLLNMTSKGGFTMQMMSMVKEWKRQQAQRPQRQDPPESATATPKLELQSTPLGRAREDLTRTASPTADFARIGRRLSEATLPEFNHQDAPAERTSERKRTAESLQWFVDAMRKWEAQEPTPPTSPAQTAEAAQPAEVKTVVITHPGQLNDEQLMQELGKRLAARATRGPYEWKPESELSLAIRQACAQLAEESEDDE